eukprot:CAMPEP_0176348098 /NCGR_PEP_ID=MMETSP0126-20121128/7594_1 /TAXON_ID=141414 ORGANISM="Strombidinopsis acuminatum, Strain SPMC142" /NCGR_SAMPLE_ID=MMETSP0126 /ASSEMBLY_ACC=CAM_ASM_000229 /LENGTH=57 /DNA_ID=CAMNT_0017696687 /DNA_START=3851 /DNA_END=4021 /DNA_ORIENTATION=+
MDDGNGNYVIGSTKIPKHFFDMEMERPDIPEEFNKKVYKLIEMACDDQRRCQMAINW